MPATASILAITREEFETFLLNKENEANRPQLSEKSATHYSRRWAQAQYELPEDFEFTADSVLEFIAEQGGSPSNHDSWVNTFKHLYSYCKWAGIETEDFTAKLALKRRPQRLPKPLTLDEVYKIFSSIPTNDWRGRRDLALHHILYCNLRNEEACKLRVLDLLDKEVRVIGKGNKERHVPVNDLAWDAILRYILETHYPQRYQEVAPQTEEQLSELFKEFRVYLERRGENPIVFLTNSGKPMYDRAVREIVSLRARAAGIQGAHPHRFRHSFATHILDGGATDLIALKDVMGHTNLRTTELYVQVSREARFNRVNAHHPFQKVR